jgi:negative regulator of sigma E activity
VLTAQEISQQYNVKYVGKQKVDEVDCYVFDVSPKVDREEEALS